MLLFTFINIYKVREEDRETERQRKRDEEKEKQNKFNSNQTMRNRMRVECKHRITRKHLPQIHMKGVEEKKIIQRIVFPHFIFLCLVISYMKKKIL